MFVLLPKKQKSPGRGIVMSFALFTVHSWENLGSADLRQAEGLIG